MKMTTSVLKKTILLALSSILLSRSGGFAQTAPELVFRNPVLVSGTALKEGAVYKFPEVMAGVDAHVKLKKFSRNDIVMATIDNSTFGWDKAFQPEFGLAGLVQPNQNWYIDFEMKFYKAGTTTKQKINKVVATALDVDGDGVSISEYYVMKDPDSIRYAPVTYLSGAKTASPVCCECGKESALVACSNCAGTGNKNYADAKKKWEADQNCKGTGKLHTECGHAFCNQWNYQMTSTIQNFTAIDTLGTQVMATYIYLQEDDINFRIGATSSVRQSNGAGIRLNSLWFKNFKLSPLVVLPIKITSFAVARKDQHLVLNWTTAGDGSISHFVAERSTGGAFLQAGVVAAGTEASHGTYSFKDPVAAGSATVQYRIRMVDAAQESSYSAIVTVHLDRAGTNGTALSTYPNPVHDQLSVKMPTAWQGQGLRLELYNSNGLRLQSTRYPQAPPVQTVPVRHLAKGVYILKAVGKAGTAQQTIYKE